MILGHEQVVCLGKVVPHRIDARLWHVLLQGFDRRRSMLIRDVEERRRIFAVLLDGQSLDPGSALPEGVLEPRLIEAYVPSSFAVCPGRWPWNTGSPEPSSILAHLPVPAQALLRGNERTYDASGGVIGGNPPRPFTCFEVTTEEARALDGIFRDAGIERIDELDSSTPSQWVVYEVRATAAFRRSFISMMPLLPHGEWGFSDAG